MSFFDTPSWLAPPGLGDIISQFKGYDPGLGMGGRIGKGMLKHLAGGVDDPYISGLLAPIREGYDANARGIINNAGAGANAMLPGQQAGLTTSLTNEALTENADKRGMAMASAVPGLFNVAGNLYNTGRQQRIQGEEFGLQGQLNAEQLYKMYNKPGLLSRIGQVAGVIGQLEGDAMGFGGVTSGLFGGGGGGGGNDPMLYSGGVGQYGGG